ncbi:hypothetical protein C9975_08145, partial [Thalassospira xiamenensis]
MTQVNFNKKQLAGIVSDAEFRELVHETYKQAQIQREFSQQRIESGLIALYRAMLEKSYRYIESNQRHLAFDLVRPCQIKNQILIAAQLGLSLNPDEKEVYFETELGGGGDL